MWSSKKFLQRCQDLMLLGWCPEFCPGMRIARGFADLGIEEFLLMPGDKLVSLCNGATSTLQEAHRKFFFVVPSDEQMVDAIQRLNFDVIALNFVDQRQWKLCVRDNLANSNSHFEHIELACALLEGLFAAFKARMVKEA